ncbi:MAG: DUF1501 domain-containing protein [Verrucomicrobiota bacterium]
MNSNSRYHNASAELRQRLDACATMSNRRTFLSGAGMGMGSLALNSLLTPNLLGSTTARTHLPARAKNVIFLHMVGAPSQLDLFDYKPKLQEYDRKLAPDEFIEGKRFAFLRGHPKLLGTPYEFKKCGEGGTYISELLPNLQTVADDLCVIRSMHTEEFNHAPAQMLFHTGLNRRGNPSIGSWVDYGLGSANENLPAYVVFLSGVTPGAGASLWNNGFLPSVHQGIQFRSEGEPVLFLDNPRSVDKNRRRRIIDGVQALNQMNHQRISDPEIVTRMEQYEMAFRMQSSVPNLMAINDEPQHIMDLYGEGEFARQCLYARRMVERGVRFVELFHSQWDTHNTQDKRLRTLCKQVDQPITALLKDLKQRGLLDDTLVIWGGEFGRTPMLQGDESKEKCGRDHHKEAFTIWMAGGGIKGGLNYGATDDMGYYVAENKVHIRDFHATLLHLLGIDHELSTFRFQGLDQRLTGVEEAHVLRDILA